MLENAVLVVAHPDDEVLWFSSILRQVGKIVIAFKEYDAVPDLGRRRDAAMAELPYANLVCLGIPEAGSLKRADWDDPIATDHGLALDAPSDTRRRYEQNFAILRTALAVELRSATDVFTHSPWGEYGHEDHVQVYRAVDSLRAAMGFRLWISSYCGARAATLAARHRDSGQPAIRLPIDQTYARQLAEIYQRHGCWTWTPDWTWPAEEWFLRGPLATATPGKPNVTDRLRFVVSEI